MSKAIHLDIFFIKITTKMPIGQQIKLLLDDLDVTQEEFAERVGSNQRTISRYINQESTPNYKLIEGIINAYPNLNTEWLTRGVGPMWKGAVDKSNLSQKTKENSESSENDWQNMTIKEVGELLKRMKKEK